MVEENVSILKSIIKARYRAPRMLLWWWFIWSNYCLPLANLLAMSVVHLLVNWADEGGTGVQSSQEEELISTSFCTTKLCQLPSSPPGSITRRERSIAESFYNSFSVRYPSCAKWRWRWSERWRNYDQTSDSIIRLPDTTDWSTGSPRNETRRRTNANWPPSPPHRRG